MIPTRQWTRSAVPRAALRPTTRAWSSPRRQQFPRFQSTSTSSSAAGGGNSHFAAGAAGGLAGAALAYGIYSFSPAGRTASKLNKAALEANKKYEAAAEKLQQNTPSADQAVDAVKHFAYSYVAWIPGGRAYLDAAFKDWETVRENHKEEADKIVNDAYKKLQDLSKAGLNLETASKAYESLLDMFKQIADLSADAISDILDNHPQVKKQFGGSIEKLQDMGRNYGPEAKKQVDETWSQIKDIFAGGFTASNVDKARKLAEDKLQQVKKLGDDAWNKGLEQAKPFLDKNPKAKELIEKNADALKQGNMKELFDKVRSAVDSGDLGSLSKYVDSAVDKAKSKGSDMASGFGLDKYLKMITQDGEIMPKLQQIGQIAEKHKQEGEKLLKETIEELKQVLDKKSQKAQEIVDQAKKESD
ncbi:Apolipoprotein/apolipophorin [Hirsutella rhossiliensis]|uniref:Apolipoprotein/apolipophorin n=1 Tax=Hirsutella rhossiliensis TaxID=111463 RepID=A0A9P8N1F6_9HYPO|nr:Apolipoprotein/apolipophorin [Hirsutella rhossiliensis]KAH0966428.1 Apolipoprotein/apolipophorin [Hirsutella rhossiliensis]